MEIHVRQTCSTLWANNYCNEGVEYCDRCGVFTAIGLEMRQVRAFGVFPCEIAVRSQRGLFLDNAHKTFIVTLDRSPGILVCTILFTIPIESYNNEHVNHDYASRRIRIYCNPAIRARESFRKFWGTNFKSERRSMADTKRLCDFRDGNCSKRCHVKQWQVDRRSEVASRVFRLVARDGAELGSCYAYSWLRDTCQCKIPTICILFVST